ncbi:MAG: HAD hydrolase-like protein [Candidatus Magasanikbacteria bacterium]|nr:HAD hydrolase-like protein [Candidatus Magasanikbacteria bacterium]
MIKAISVDLGGVLFSEGKKIALDKLKKEFGYSRRKILKLIRGRHSKVAADWRRGKVKEKDFWEYVQKNLPVGYDVELIKKEWWNGYKLDQKILDLIIGLKSQGYKIMAFSGNVKDRIDFLEDKYHFRQYFDEEVYSFDEGLIKADEDFYDCLIEKSGCSPEEIVHIDDQEKVEEVGGGKGINFIFYKDHNIKKLKKDLATLKVKLD